jgi:RNA recognition motif-containing protein
MPRAPDGSTRGFGFLTFLSVREAEDAARHLDGKQVFGRSIKANIAKARPPRSDMGFGGGGGGGGYGGSSYGGGGGHGGGGGRPAVSSKVYVGNLPMDTTERELEDLFERYGRIKVVQLKRVRASCIHHAAPLDHMAHIHTHTHLRLRKQRR